MLEAEELRNEIEIAPRYALGRHIADLMGKLKISSAIVTKGQQKLQAYQDAAKKMDTAIKAFPLAQRRVLRKSMGILHKSNRPESKGHGRGTKRTPAQRARIMAGLERHRAAKAEASK